MTAEEVIKMGKDRDDKDGDKPGRHDGDREGHVHEETAKNIDPSKYGTDDDDDDAEQLITVLDCAGVLPAAWRETFLAVPRHAFLPAKFWVDDGENAPQPVNRDTDPGRWLAAANADVTVVTQFDDGATVWPAIGTYRTSSASDPSMVATMLDCLDVRPGQRVLEIGTGTGYNAALLAHRLGTA